MPGLSVPPFEVTPKTLGYIVELMRLVGRYEGLLSPKPQPKLRRHNQIRTVLGSLAIEGNTLTMDQATAILDNKRVIGSKREILEVENAIGIYARARTFNPTSVRDLLRAHKSMMQGLIENAGRFRSSGVGIFQGSRLAHVAPPAKRVPILVENLLRFARAREPHPLVKSAVVHYELEFIHPFADGNGRMGRLWQHVILARWHPVFEYLPVESIVFAKQNEYYRVLEACDKAGNSTLFIEFSLDTIRESLDDFLKALRPSPVTPSTRLEIAHSAFGKGAFSRKDYMACFGILSTATASRDLKVGVDEKLLIKNGDKALAKYRFR
ncbi:MAG: Fic family protein [Polyangiaceae bacterium]|nr:Fic family protein [Polyangiaceae bacterium]